MGVLNSSGVLRKVHSFILRFKAPTCLLGVTKIMCEAPLFFIEKMDILYIQPMVMFCLATTLCECGGTLNVVVRLEFFFVPLVVPHLVSNANHITKMFKVHPKFWHVIMAKLHDLPMQLAIKWASVILSVMVVHNEEKKFNYGGHWPISFDPI